MEWTERRWKILILLCLVLALMGGMAWMGTSSWDAIMGGVEDFESSRAQRDLDKQKVDEKRNRQIDDLKDRRAREAEQKKLNLLTPKPEALPKPLGQAITDAVPRGATTQQIEEVAGVFRDVADLVAKKKDFKDPETDIDVPATPKLVLQKTKADLATVLGPNAARWESFAIEMADALATYFSGLNRERGVPPSPGTEPAWDAQDFVKPWNEIADGLMKAKPKG